MASCSTTSGSGSSPSSSSSGIGGTGNGHGVVRRATHAGSWYTNNERELNRQLDEWLAQAAHCGSTPGARAIVAPHAGYAYCGATAAHAYKQIDPERVDRIFILGPSHHVCLSGCAVTSCSKYRTPLYDLDVDQRVNQELLASGGGSLFETMDLKVDEAEHSIEMHLPYIAKVMESRHPSSFSIVPVLVGSVGWNKQPPYGLIFSRYMADPRNLFIISSDFCHWGNRFHFTPFDRHSGLEVHEHIEALDREGMRVIETMNPALFNDYLKRTQNTICGRHPIALMLQAAEHFRQTNNHLGEFRFVDYAQSNRCRHLSDSSVSYAAGAFYVRPAN